MGSFQPLFNIKRYRYKGVNQNKQGILIDSFREYKTIFFLQDNQLIIFTPQVFIEQEEADPEQTINLENRSIIEGFGLSDRMNITSQITV